LRDIARHASGVAGSLLDRENFNFEDSLNHIRRADAR